MRTIEWHDGTVVTIDQTRLPDETVCLEMKNVAEVTEAIKTMKIRGAPLLGASAAFALALAAYNSEAEDRKILIDELQQAGETLKRTRPTAVNLFWAVDRILDGVKNSSENAKNLAAFVVAEAQKIADEDATANRLMGKHGAELIHDGDVIMTHCNAGALATVDYGTALGVIKSAWNQGKKIEVIATETRPKLQGARLTIYELRRDGIPVTLITDSMVGYVMYKGLISEVVVGADRIVRDAVFNKIGTYTIAVLAREHKVPFYVAAPKSTFDLTRTSKDVTIEERQSTEVTHVCSQRITLQGTNVFNPAFDITPLEYVTAIICEKGVLHVEDISEFKANL